MKGLRAALRFPLDALRAAAIFVFALLVLVVYGAGRLGIAIARRGERKRAARARWRGRVLRFSMVSLGATFVKLGQVMSTRADLFPPETIDELKKLQDRLPGFAFWRVRRVIEKDLGGRLEDRFPEFDHVPVAAASVAQVHRARLATGEEVAVKVLRPAIRRGVLRDEAILLFGARLMALSPKIRLSDPVAHIYEFCEAILQQTDLRIERENYRRFRENFAKVPGVRFPAVHEQHSSERVLTLEFVRGTKLDALAKGDHQRLAAIVRRTMLKMCFEDGFLHSDMHPGNLLVADEDHLIVLDVGLAKQLPDIILEQFIDMSRCLTIGTPEDLIAHMKKFHRYLEGVDWDTLRDEVSAFAAKFRARKADQLEYGELIGGMLALGRKYRVRPLPELTMVFVALVTIEGIGKQLDPGSDVLAEVGAFLLPIIARRAQAQPPASA